MEEEMRKVRVQDVVTQSMVSILNLAARRIAKEDERDLEQARVGIEAVRALVDLLEPEAAARGPQRASARFRSCTPSTPASRRRPRPQAAPAAPRAAARPAPQQPARGSGPPAG